MQVNATTSSTSSTDTSTDASSRIPTQTLNQQDFLTLLVKQMTSQDPLNPQKDTDFIAQMAQFTSLEQTKTMQADIAALRDSQSVLQAATLIGTTVTVQSDKTTTVQGVVSAVTISDGKPKIIVNDKQYDLSQLVQVSPTPTTTN